METPNIKMYASQLVQQELGKLRSFCSEAAAQDPETNEEILFERLTNEFFAGLAKGTIEVFDISKANKLMDIFKRNG